MTAILRYLWKALTVAVTTVRTGLSRITSALVGVLAALLLWVVIGLGAVVLTHVVGSPLSVPGALQLTGTSLFPEASPGGVQVDPHPMGFPLAVILTAAVLIGIGHRSTKAPEVGSRHPDTTRQFA